MWEWGGIGKLRWTRQEAGFEVARQKHFKSVQYIDILKNV